ncbi:MAG: D-alanine--D-alanine ligase [Anaerosomatales bacterium]|nr:D-alanine--D-alanine ligase [Coriobacteriia bacterium]MDI6692033.1 D-alanine--D-alanine ligase [Anaerosomatales bacterium]MDI6843174.1 D-alanine--D-alanine ligase [Anaerosomatales bacterium]
MQVPDIAGVRVAVLMGGRSAEREVSLNTGEQVVAALRERGADALAIDAADASFIDDVRASRPDVVFICLHGRYGEDGTVQGLLELLDLPYVGSGVLASALAMDKVASKHVFAGCGVPTPEYAVVRRDRPWQEEDVAAAVGERCVVKPASEGSAIGVSIVHDPSELREAIETAFRYDDVVLVERFIAGTEVTVGVLGTSTPFALPTLEIVPEHEFYDYESKYVPGMSRHIIPARIPEAARKRCEELAVAAHEALGCSGVSRTDIMVEPDGRAWVLEVNTIPGMTRTSLLPDAARAAGIEFPDLCALLVGYALEESSGAD